MWLSLASKEAMTKKHPRPLEECSSALYLHFTVYLNIHSLKKHYKTSLIMSSHYRVENTVGWFAFATGGHAKLSDFLQRVQLEKEIQSVTNNSLCLPVLL